MTILRTAVAGDVDDYRDVIIDDVEDLDAVDEVEAHVWRIGVHAVDPVTLAASVHDSLTRTVRVLLGDATGWLATLDPADLFDEPFLVEYQLTMADGSVWTWPNGTPDQLPVRGSGDIVVP
jgi:hypothetical protein